MRWNPRTVRFLHGGVPAEHTQSFLKLLQEFTDQNSERVPKTWSRWLAKFSAFFSSGSNCGNVFSPRDVARCLLLQPLSYAALQEVSAEVPPQNPDEASQVPADKAGFLLQDASGLRFLPTRFCLEELLPASAIIFLQNLFIFCRLVSKNTITVGNLTLYQPCWALGSLSCSGSVHPGQTSPFLSEYFLPFFSRQPFNLHIIHVWKVMSLEILKIFANQGYNQSPL